MEEVTITVSEKTDRAFSRLAREEYAGDEDAAATALLSEWIERRS